MNFSIIEIGFLKLYVFGLFLAFGSLVFLIISKLIRKRWLMKDDATVFSLWWELSLSALFGGRVFEIFFNRYEYFANPSMVLNFWERPLSGIGAFLGANLALYFLMRHRPDHKGATFDVFYTSLFAMMVFVYSGLFVSGELGGSPSGIEFSMWGINFPSMHPLALYMAMASFFVFVLLCLMWKKDVRVGLIATAGMFFYGGMTVVGELFRFSDDVVTVFNDVPLLILIGIFICFVAVVSLISTFVVLKKRSHVVHHLYEEDVEK